MKIKFNVALNNDCLIQIRRIEQWAKDLQRIVSEIDDTTKKLAQCVTVNKKAKIEPKMSYKKECNCYIEPKDA